MREGLWETKESKQIVYKISKWQRVFQSWFKTITCEIILFWCTKSKSPAITLPTYIGPDDSQIKFMRKSNNYARLIYPNIFPVTDSHSILSQTKQKKFQARKIHGE